MWGYYHRYRFTVRSFRFGDSRFLRNLRGRWTSVAIYSV